VPLLFSEKICETLANFNNFWHATSEKTSRKRLVLTISL